AGAGESQCRTPGRPHRAGGDCGGAAGAGARGGARGPAGPEGCRDRGDLRGASRAEKKAWGELRQRWAPPDLRDAVVDFVNQFSERTELPVRWIVTRLGVSPAQFYRWLGRYGRANG